MPYFIQPIALFQEQTLTTLCLWEFDVDQVVGMPDNIPTTALLTDTSVSEPAQNPTVGDCIEVCGSNDCDYLRAMPGLNKNGELSVSERVARDILGDVDDEDDLSIQRAAWGLAPQEKCGASQAQKKLRKRQWYPDPHGQEYDYAPWTDYYVAEQDPYLYESQYGELPLEFYEPKEYDTYHKHGQAPNLQSEYPRVKNTPNNTPQTQQSNKNVKITNDNSGSVNGKERKNDERINSALTDPPRRNVGAPSPATKPNLNKGSTKRYPIGTMKPKSCQSSSSESYSSDPIIAFHSAPTADDVPAQAHVDAQAESPEYAYDRAEGVPEAATQTALQDPSVPRVQKTEHPDGSIEYSFGVVSGEVSVYNEGDTPKKRGRNKSVISNLKSQLGIDDESPRDRTGWMRKSKRHVVPENKPNAKNVQEKTEGEEGDVEIKELVQAQRGPNQKADFLRVNGNKPLPKKLPPQPAPSNNKQAPKKAAPTPQQPQPQPQPEQSEEEAEAAAQQEITDQRKAEFERLRRLSIKQFYKDLAANGQDVSRDKEAEKKITEEATRVSAENAQKKREERARRLQGKEPKAEDSA